MLFRKRLIYMDYLARQLIDPTRPSDDCQIGPVWSKPHPHMNLRLLVIPGLTVSQRKTVLTAMRVQPLALNPRLRVVVAS
jgi:hypothetical protein